MKGTNKVILAVTMTVGLLIGMQSASYADPPAPTPMALFLWDLGSSLVIVPDGDILDSNSAAGTVTFIGSVGTWSVNVTTGITYPVLGTTGSPEIDLNSVNVSSTGPASLQMMVSALGYTFAPGEAVFQIGGTTTGIVTAGAFSGGDYFDLATPLGGLVTFSSPAFSGSVNGTVPGFPNPYSLTVFADIEHGGAGSTSFDANMTVPEPATLLFLGFGLVGLVGVRRKFQE